MRFWRRWRRRDQNDLADELRSHVEIEIERLRDLGLSEADALREARLRFGNPASVAERVADVHPTRWLDTLWQDVRYGVRLMRRSPSFTAIAVLVLSLGIGVNTALFSIVNAIFFRPIPVERPDELVYLYTVNQYGQAQPYVNNPDFWIANAGALADFGGHFQASARLTLGDETDRVSGERVTANYFDLLGVKPFLGRTFGPAEDDPANPERALVISHDLWTRRFNADPDVIGLAVRLETWAFRIVGVAPPGFDGLSDPWTPSQYWATSTQTRRVPPGFRTPGFMPEASLARLKPGVSIDQLRALVAAKWPEVVAWNMSRLPTTNPNFVRLSDGYRKSHLRVERIVDVRMPFDPDAEPVPVPVLAAVTTVVGLVLLIAAANIAGLLLARGVTRTGEVAVRRALGAAGLRLARQLLTESVLLSTIGGALGLAIAWNLVRLFVASTPERYAVDVALDLRVLLFAAATCVGAGILVGLAPALQATKVNVLEALGSGIVGARHARGRLRHWIVIPQVGLSLTLLLVAGVHVGSLAKVELNDVGYSTDGAVILTVGRWEPDWTTRPGTAEERRLANEEAARKVRTFNRAVLERVRQVPGVTSFGLASNLPVYNLGFSPELPSVIARDAPDGAASTGAWQATVSDGYFDAMGIRLRQGRTFDDRDALFGKKVAVISAGLARALWPKGDAIGRSLGYVSRESADKPDWLEVIGIVDEVDSVLGQRRELPRVYVSILQQWRGDAPTLVVRGMGNQADLIRQVKAAVISTDAFAEVTAVRTIEQIVAGILYPQRLAAAILAVSGLIGLVLASIGLYGIVSYSVAERIREIGIRATLGADRRDIVLLILKEGTRVALAGSVAGLAIGAAGLRIAARVIPNLPTGDLATFIAVPAVLTAVILVAGYLPARRAARVDPVEVLRGT